MTTPFSIQPNSKQRVSKNVAVYIEDSLESTGTGSGTGSGGTGQKGQQGVKGPEGLKGEKGPIGKTGESFQVNETGELIDTKISDIQSTISSPNFYIFLVTIDSRSVQLVVHMVHHHHQQKIYLIM